MGVLRQPPDLAAVIVERGQLDAWLNEFMVSPFIVQLAPDMRSAVVHHGPHSGSAMLLLLQAPKQLIGTRARAYPGLAAKLRVVRSDAVADVASRCDHCLLCGSSERNSSTTTTTTAAARDASTTTVAAGALQLHKRGVLLAALSQECLAVDLASRGLTIQSCNYSV